jgi:hypothetical protein
MEGLAACCEDLEDPRAGKAGRHDLVEIMVIALCTVLCGGQFASDMELFARGSVSPAILEARKGIAEPRHFLPGFPPPRSGTISRLLAKVHGQVFASLPRRRRHGREGVVRDEVAPLSTTISGVRTKVPSEPLSGIRPQSRRNARNALCYPTPSVGCVPGAEDNVSINGPDRQLLTS